MNYTKTIRILEPFGGWGVHSDYYNNNDDTPSKSNDDTGLCNRLFHWEVFYDIFRKIGDDDITLIVQDWIWPELDLLYIPNTVSVMYPYHGNHWYGTFEHADLFFKTIFDENVDNVYMSEKMTYDSIKEMYTNNKFDLSSKNHWYTEYQYITLNKIYGDIGKDGFEETISDRSLRHIRIKNKIVDDKLRSKSSDKIGIHIRRGNGVLITEDDVLTLPVHMQPLYREYIKDNVRIVNEAYTFVEDKYYFDFMDAVLEKNPNQQFYISHDLPDNFLDHYYERYKGLIVTKKDNREFYLKYYSEKIPHLTKLISYANVIDNMIDLFSLAYCGYVLASQVSSWSSFARVYNQKGSENISNVEALLTYNKEKFIEEVLSYRNDLNVI